MVLLINLKNNKMNLEKLNLSELSIENKNNINGGTILASKGGAGWWGLLAYVIDEIYEGIKRPCEC